MPTVEERLQTLEQEHGELKKTIELQTIAIGALVNKNTLEKLNEKYDRIFEALIAHDRFTNEQLTGLREQQTETDGKITGLQTEMRQRFTEQDNKTTRLDGKVVGLQTEMRQRFTEQDNKIERLDSRVTELQTTQTEHTSLLRQILERLP